jgi:hypothetical protein
MITRTVLLVFLVPLESLRFVLDTDDTDDDDDNDGDVSNNCGSASTTVVTWVVTEFPAQEVNVVVSMTTNTKN